MHLPTVASSLGALLLAVSVTATPVAIPSEDLNDFDSNDLEVRADTKPFRLRILTLGASIVWGVGSTTGNGFRGPLREHLRSEGWPVNMVGSKRNGKMADNQTESNPGDVIAQVHEKSKNSYKFKPNVACINAGTNDANTHLDIPNAGKRMDALIADLWKAPDMAKTLIVLSTVLPTTGGGETDRKKINDQYRELVKCHRAEGKPIVLADMDLVLTTKDLTSDGTHPTDAGHAKMASGFWTAIEKAHADKLIIKPVAVKIDGPW
ncbi:SGNH hydrolase-type esterase domain-containing protein [Halenospora varia]|nr:SGNH hydrolase-type esterase domain-containing protein [Halenospora varia]